MSKWNKVGSLRKAKSGNNYIKVDKDITLKKDSILTMIDPRKSIQSSIESGKLSEEKGTALLEKLPDYIRYELFIVEE